jgi:hypothetical protein
MNESAQEKAQALFRIRSRDGSQKPQPAPAPTYLNIEAPNALMNITIDALTSNIQLALAPVFLLTAVATLVGAISTRLARTVDRMRFVQNALYGNQALSDKLRMHYEIELREFKMRGRLCTVAIFFNVLSGVLISLTVLELFFFQTGSVALLQTGYVVATFVLGLISFMTSLLIVLAEVVHAYRSASWDMPPS